MKIFKRTGFYKLDWPNHLVGFMSALLGILIAFQLDDWQARRQQEERIETTLKALRTELESNRAIYEENINVLKGWLEYRDFMVVSLKGDDHLVANEALMNRMKSRHQERLKNVQFIRKINDTLSHYSTRGILLDVIPRTGISTSNWEAAKASGILNYMDHETLSLLSDAYGWIERDMGMSESEFYRHSISPHSFDDVTRIIANFKLIIEISEFKLERINALYVRMVAEKKLP